MSRRLADLTEELTLAQLKTLLKVKEEMLGLEDRRAKAAAELKRIDDRLAVLRGSIGGTAKPQARGRPRKAATIRTRAVTKSTGRSTVAGVVAEVIRAKGRAMTFQEIRAAIADGALIKTKSKNFDNVLRRTLSTSDNLKRIARGVYGVKGVTGLPPVSGKTVKAKTTKKAAAKKTAKKKTVKKKVMSKTKKKVTASVTAPKKKAAKKKAAKKKTAKKKVTKKTAAKTPRAAAKKTAKKAQTVESVVVDLLRKEKGTMSFQEILKRITTGKLIKTKSKNFANVLRRTLSTSTKVSRPSRGVYALKG